MIAEFSNFGITGYINIEAPPEFRASMSIVYYWHEGLADWEQLLPASPPRVSQGTSFDLAVGWRNDSSVAICGHVDLTIIKPDGTEVTPRDIEGQNTWADPGGGSTVAFDAVALDQEGTYEARVTISTMGQVLDEEAFNVASVSVPRMPDYLGGKLIGDVLYYACNGTFHWSTTRNWYCNLRSLALFPIMNTGSVRAPVGIDFMGVHESVWLDPGQSINWEIAVQVLEGTHTYPYYIFAIDPSTGQEWIVEEGSLTITGIWF